MSRSDYTYTIRPHREEARYPMITDGNLRYLALRAIIPTTDGFAIAEFERVRPAILRVLEETGAGPCWFLTAARLDCPTAPVTIPTILVLCSNPKSCRTELEAIDTELRIMVAMGEPVFRALDPENTGHSQRVPMGSSIGVKGVFSSGTLGGYIFDPIAKKRYGLTNGHVAAMHLKGRQLSMPVVVTESAQVVIVQNSDEDYAQQETARMERLARMAAFDQFYNGVYPRWAARIAAAQLEADMLEKPDRELGIVEFGHLGIADSDTPTSKCWKDIGVINVRQDRLGESFSDPTNRGSFVYGHTPITAGLGVHKVIGRTTEAQEGIINGVMADCCMACPLVKDSPTFTTREWIVIQPVLGEPVSIAGDSGTFFVLKSARGLIPVVGMMFGGAQLTWPPPVQRERRMVMGDPLTVVGVFYSTTQCTSAPTSERDGAADSRDEAHNETEPVAGAAVEGAAGTGPLSDAADVTEEQKATDKTCHLAYYEPSPLYRAEISIITPATTILSWLAQDLGRELEFGEPL